MRHLYQECVSIWSTENNLPEITDPLRKESDTPEKEPGNMQTHDIYISVEKWHRRSIKTRHENSQLNLVVETATVWYYMTMTQIIS